MLGSVRLAAALAALLLAPAVSAADSWWRDAVGAAELTPPGPGVPITVIDTGADLSHPGFATRPWTTALNAQTVLGGREGHGTSVASVIGLGLYPQARLLSWDASPGGFLTNAGIVSGLQAAPAPGIANLSLGGRSWNRAEADAVAAAYGRGIVPVAAAGNDGERDSAASFPADLPHVLTVGSVGRDGQPSAFTTRSRAIDVAAPGEDVLTAVPPDGYTTARGTSVAAPFVSAALAWIWTQRPELDHTQLVELVRRTARDVGPPGRDDQSGFGVIDVAAALGAPAPIPIRSSRTTTFAGRRRPHPPRSRRASTRSRTQTTSTASTSGRVRPSGWSCGRTALSTWSSGTRARRRFARRGTYARRICSPRVGPTGSVRWRPP